MGDHRKKPSWAGRAFGNAVGHTNGTATFSYSDDYAQDQPPPLARVNEVDLLSSPSDGCRFRPPAICMLLVKI